MTIELTPQDKLPIVEQHIKQVLFAQYNVELNLIEAKAGSKPDQVAIDNINNQLDQINTQIAALQTEHDAITAQINTTTTTPSN